VGAERERLGGPAGRDGLTAWHEWGPYVAARAWGTVREDYSADGEAWDFFPHEHARSRAYRWGEDALAGVCDARQGLCIGLALWNGRDPFLKERAFGLANAEGNHGEDAKDHWWHLDAVPTSSWLSWRYHYPQAEFPYEQLVTANAGRTVDDAEYELVDSGVFDDDRYWVVDVDYAKADVDDLCMRIRVRNAGPEAATLHVLPHVWFRNTWAWGKQDPSVKPSLRLSSDGEAVEVEHPARLGRWTFVAASAGGEQPQWLFCENDTNTTRLWGDDAEVVTPHPKDAINDRVVSGADTVNPARVGTKSAGWFTVSAGPGETVELRARLTRGEAPAPDALGEGFAEVLRRREAEADEFYAEVIPPGTTTEEARIARQAFAGLLWSRQFYRYDVDRWIDGDPAEPKPPPGRGEVRNGGWRHLDANDVIVMPDTWEYPWFASWDLAFHCVVLAHVDPALAKQQLLLLTREWFQHPNGQLPAYEWDFSDANPPVHAWAAMRVFEIDGSTDRVFLARMMHKLLINFTWWVNREDAEGNNVFEGGFLGLDNIGPFNRSEALPGGNRLEQSDGTAWMAMYCLNLLEMALRLAEEDHTYEDLAVKFLEHFTLIATAMNDSELWDEEDGFYYDAIRRPDGSCVRVQVRSMVGLIPLVAVAVGDGSRASQMPELVERILWFLEHKPSYAGHIGRVSRAGPVDGSEPAGSGVGLDDAGAVDSGSYVARAEAAGGDGAGSDAADHAGAVGNTAAAGTGDALMASVVSVDRLGRLLERMLDTEEFLSPHGLRSLSKWHEANPFSMSLDGFDASVDYQPAESRSRLFGGNSNWRGPVWFPLNVLVLESLLRMHRFIGDDLTVDLPTGSGRKATLAEVADDLAERLISLFRRGEDGRRPAATTGGLARFESHPDWQDLPVFYEYFHGDDGGGLGAAHQTGWTAFVADLILARPTRRDTPLSRARAETEGRTHL
jgi:hypothetical protein